jgi:hypothetical protein
MSTQKEKEESSKAETTEQQPKAPQSGRSPEESAADTAVHFHPGLAAEQSQGFAFTERLSQ